jgi:hypothetical protein
MNAYRLMAMAVTTCAAGLSLAACTAGITTASPVASRSPATSRTASSSAPAALHASSAASTSSADTVSVDAPIGRFPIPHGAKVLYNSTCDKQVLIELSSVTPAKASSFYISALPRAGYKITGNSLLANTGDGLPGSAAQIEFTGHGYNGTITAVSDLGALSSMGPSPAAVPSSIAKNFFTITLTPPGEAGCAVPTAP